MATFTTRPTLMGSFGMVAAGHYLAAAAGLRVLERGGNAVDAGVTAGIALSVLKPHDNGIGGEAPTLIAPAPGSANADPARPVVAINGQGWAPRRATIDYYRSLGIDVIPGDGYLPATVPGAFGAYATALLRYGTIGIDEALAPAIDLAESGFPMYPPLDDAIARYAQRFRDEWPTTAAIYLAGGTVPKIGQLIRNPDWATAFKAVASAAIRERSRGREAGIQAALDYFYRGPIAERIATFIRSKPVRDASGRAHLGLIEASDFAEYETRVEAPVSFDFRGTRVFKCGPWNQGPVFLQQLALLANADLERLGHNSADYIHTVAEAAKLAFADREAYYGDPAFVDVPLDRLLSPEYNRARFALIDPARANGEQRPGKLRARPAAGWQPSRAADPNDYVGDTTHVDVIDRWGTLFSCTPSGGWIPTSPVIAGLGFPIGTRGQMFRLDPSHPNALQPKKRPRTTLTPSIAFRADQPWLAFGTPGGDTQDQSSLQFFLNVVVFGMSLQEAIDAPTFWSEHHPNSFYPRASYPNRLAVETRLDTLVLAELARRGHELRPVGDWSGSSVSACAWDPATGLISAAASPRGLASYVMGH
jgi:gamma-glutamyltranspeptidase/glutathione hydrolase